MPLVRQDVAGEVAYIIVVEDVSSRNELTEEGNGGA